MYIASKHEMPKMKMGITFYVSPWFEAYEMPKKSLGIAFFYFWALRFLILQFIFFLNNCTSTYF